MATVQRYVNTASTAGGDGTTNATSGSTRAYASLSEWEANAGGSATDDYIVDCCGSTADTTAVTIDFTTNITTGSVLVRGNTGEADGFYDGDAVISTSHYRIEAGNVANPLRFNETRTTADGIQINAAHTGLNGYAIFTTAGEFTVRRCRLLNTSSTDYGVGNSSSLSSNVPRLIENNLIVGFDLAGVSVIVTNFATPTVTIQHNTIYGDGSTTSGGIRYGGSGTNTGTVFAIKGNAVGNCGSGNDLVKVSASGSTDNFDDNAFESSESTSGEIALGTLTDAWTSPGTATSSDFTVKNSSSPLNFTVTGALVSTDIRGTTRSNYSVGAFELVSAGGTSITPPNGSATLVGYAPSLISPQSITPAAGGMSLTGLAAALSTAFKLTPDVGTLSIQGYAPSLAQNFSISPDTGALALLGSAPGLIQGFLLTPDTGSLALSGYAPSLGTAGSINPSDGTLTLVGYQPGVTQQSFVVPGAGSLTITGLTPSVAGAGTLIPSEANLTLVGYQPGVTQQTFIVPGVGAISVEAHAPLLVGNTYVVPGVGAATFAGYAPTVGLGTVVSPGAGQILLAGGTPSVIADSGSSIITPASGSLGFVGYTPTVLTAVFVTGNGRVFWLPAQSVEWVLRAQSTEWIVR